MKDLLLVQSLDQSPEFSQGAIVRRRPQSETQGSGRPDDLSGMKDLLLILARCSFARQDSACVAVYRASETTVSRDDPHENFGVSRSWKSESDDRHATGRARDTNFDPGSGPRTCIPDTYVHMYFSTDHRMSEYKSMSCATVYD